MTRADPDPATTSPVLEACDLLKILAHPTRMILALRLRQGECAVSDLERELGIRQPGLSQHLSDFREARLVTTRREHKAVFYTLSDARCIALLDALGRIVVDPGSEAALRPPPPRPAEVASWERRARETGAAMFARTGD